MPGMKGWNFFTFHGKAQSAGSKKASKSYSYCLPFGICPVEKKGASAGNVEQYSEHEFKIKNLEFYNIWRF